MTNHFDEFGARGGELGADTAQAGEQAFCQADCQGAEPNSDCCSTIQRDRFELLSAYLDGEVTAAERRQVEGWLATDPKTQKLYRRLLSLRQGLQTLPINSPSQTVDQLVDQVTARVERQPRRLAWGGLAAAGLLIGALFSAMPPDRYTPSLAERATSQDVPTDGLMIALNHPPIELPQTANLPVATPSLAEKSHPLR